MTRYDISEGSLEIHYKAKDLTPFNLFFLLNTFNRPAFYLSLEFDSYLLHSKTTPLTVCLRGDPYKTVSFLTVGPPSTLEWPSSCPTTRVVCESFLREVH